MKFIVDASTGTAVATFLLSLGGAPYQKINIDILEKILQEHLGDFIDFSAQLLRGSKSL